jgi:hypothetical protein
MDVTHHIHVSSEKIHDEIANEVSQVPEIDPEGALAIRPVKLPRCATVWVSRPLASCG